MSRFSTMPRAYRRQLQTQDMEAVDHALREAGALYDETWGPLEHHTQRSFTGTAPGDARKLRGIPAIGRSVRGAIPGSVPGEELWR